MLFATIIYYDYYYYYYYSIELECSVPTVSSHHNRKVGYNIGEKLITLYSLEKLMA
jgi:hypothetical protein